MFSRNTSKWAKRAVIAASAVTVLAIASGGAIAASTCKKVNGKLSLQPVTPPGPACTSPIGLCATASLSGDLAGNSEFTGTSLTPTVDTPTTAVVLLTGDNLIHTNDGDLMTKDAIVLRTIGAGDFAEVDTIIGGTGGWAGATGSFSAIGTFTPAAGGEGDYTGEVCTP